MNEYGREQQVASPNKVSKATYARRWANVISGAGMLVFGAVQGARAVEHHFEPAPVGCEITVPAGETVSGIATKAAQYTGTDSRKIVYDLGQSNPGVNMGEVDAGQQLRAADYICSVVAQHDIVQFTWRA